MSSLGNCQCVRAWVDVNYMHQHRLRFDFPQATLKKRKGKNQKHVGTLYTSNQHNKKCHHHIFSFVFCPVHLSLTDSFYLHSSIL